MSLRKRRLSICGTVTAIHLSAVLAVTLYARSLAGPDGDVWVDETTRPKLEFVDRAYSLLLFPLLYLLPSVFDGRGGVTYGGTVVAILLMAANSALIGSGVAWVWTWFRKANDL